MRVHILNISHEADLLTLCIGDQILNTNFLEDIFKPSAMFSNIGSKSLMVATIPRTSIK